MMKKRKSFSRRIIAAALSALIMLLCLMPAFAVSGAALSAQSNYEVRVRIETTSDADAWKSASMTIYTASSNGRGSSSSDSWSDIVSNVDDESDVFDVSEDYAGFPTRVEIYTDFGGGFTWRSWEADVTVYVNDVNIASKHIYASSSAFSSSDTLNTVYIDETKYPYPANIELTAPSVVKSEEDIARASCYAYISDQYDVFWVDYTDVILTDGEYSYTTIMTQDCRYRWNPSCIGRSDKTIPYTLKIKSDNSIHAETTKTFEISYQFPRRLNIISGGDIYQTVVGYQGDRYPVSFPELKKDGVTLSWAHDGGGAYMPNDEGGPVYVFGAEDGSLTAEYKANTYTVMFLGNGSTSGSMSGRKYSCGNTYTLIANVYAKKGYEFVGWNTMPDGSGDAYANKASVKNLATENDAVVNLYAQWKIKTYTVTFVNKQTGERIAQSVEYGGDASAPAVGAISVSNDRHYAFTKWNKAYTNITANTTVTAVFAEEPHSYRTITAAQAASLGLGDRSGRYCEICGHFVASAIPEGPSEIAGTTPTEKSTEAVAPADPATESSAPDHNEQTEQPTDEEPVVPISTDNPARETASSFGGGSWWIVAAAVLLAAGAIIFLIIRKKRIANK